MASANYGIDIVLGAQWGDEGKGKLVDMLSQVRVFVGLVREHERFMYFFIGRHKTYGIVFLGTHGRMQGDDTSMCRVASQVVAFVDTFIFLLFIMPRM